MSRLRARKLRAAFTDRPWLVWVPVVLTIAFLSYSTWKDNEGVADYGALALNVLLLIVTATTLQLAIPEPAKLWVHRQDELGLTDLIFYVVGDSPEGIPRDYLLQFHVAVSNVGGRRAVLSKLELKNLVDGSGEVANLRLSRVSGSQYTTRQRWIDTMPVLEGQRPNLEHFAIRDDIRGPFSMQPDDVVSLRLRARSGIDWSERWTLDALTVLATQLERGITHAIVTASYRRGDELVNEDFTVPIQVAQQSMYLSALHFQTRQLTVHPNLPLQPFFD